MKARPDELRHLTRRTLLLGSGAALLASCSSDATSSDTSSNVTLAATPESAPAPTAATVPASEVGTTVEATEPTTTDVESTEDPQPNDREGLAALTAADFVALGTCVLLPDTTAGPFPLDEQFDRRDITEGYPGHALRLGLRVIDAACDPVPGAAVEIWQADATGDYSAFLDNGGGKDEGPGTTFLRGTQVADADGIVEFASIYPGWYRGRAVHIHLRVHLDEAAVLTSQLFFDDHYTAQIYDEEPYAANGLPDTPNAQDRIAGDVATSGTLLHLRPGQTSTGDGTVGLVNVAID